MFKTVNIFKLDPAWGPTIDEMEAALPAFVSCGQTQEKSIGWVPPRGEANGALVESVAGQRILKLLIETKTVPAAELNKKAQEAAAQIEHDTGRKPGKKQMKELREEALLALLPQAFAKTTAVLVWIDLDNNRLITDASSQGKNDEVVTALVNAFNSLSMTLLQTAMTPQTCMTNWLMAKEADEIPGGLTVERECELKSGDEEKSVVKFSRHSLATDEVRKHITEGKLPTKLALSWEGRIGFVLAESGALKKVAFLEGVFDDRTDDSESGFDADVALATGELNKLIPDLVQAMGGEVELTLVGA
jgi:recombination associated protein RdgC